MIIYIDCDFFLPEGRRNGLIGVFHGEIVFLVSDVGVFGDFSFISAHRRV